MARKSKGGGEGGGLPGWMATYGDMVTLLLCFFVLLFAMSTVDANKFKNAVYAFRGTFGVMTGGATLNPADLVSSAKMEGKGSSYKYQSIAKKIKGDMEKFAGQEKAGEKAKNDSDITEKDSSEAISESFTIEVTARGIVISVAEKFLFDSGKANLKENAGPVLDMVLDTIASLPNAISVEGHTDNIPINTFQFPSNWELSGARAASVVKYFLGKKPEMGDRISLAGYAETKPKAVNNTMQGRSTNRRVEILILKSIDEQYEEKISQEVNTIN